MTSRLKPGLLPRDAEIECGVRSREQVKPASVHSVGMKGGRPVGYAWQAPLTHCTLGEVPPTVPILVMSAFWRKLTLFFIVGLASFTSRITVYILVHACYPDIIINYVSFHSQN